MPIYSHGGSSLPAILYDIYCMMLLMGGMVASGAIGLGGPAGLLSRHE